MKSLFFILCTLCFLSLNAQQEIKLNQIKDHIGDSVKVQGVILGVRYLDGAKNTPTFINVGGNYPNQLLTVVIWGDVRQKLLVTPSSKDNGNRIIVSGKVELYNDNPQIIIRNTNQFEIVQDAQRDVDMP